MVVQVEVPDVPFSVILTLIFKHKSMLNLENNSKSNQGEYL